MRVVAVLALCAVVVVAVGLWPRIPGLALNGEAESDQTSAVDALSYYPNCLECHGDPTLSMTFPSGESVSMFVDLQHFEGSVHNPNSVGCVDCHQRNVFYPHRKMTVYSRREFSVAEYELCKRCHFDNYTRTLDSVHFEAMSKGSAAAPICTDCHGSHDVAKANGSHLQITETCANCHAEIYTAYADSVHGEALTKDNPDVPVCTTCHGVHNIHEAETAAFRLGSVDLCVKCHSDKELMDKYEISSAVTKTYLEDFHGKTVGFYQGHDQTVWPEVAVCTDCHGVHDIRSADDPESRVVKDNLVETCRRCHPDASTSFPSAWLSHYEPSFDKHPLVFMVMQYYKVLIPLMVVGLALNVGLDLWRLARNR